MPRLSYLNKVWVISSDDFPVLIGCQCVLRFVYIVASCVAWGIFIASTPSNHCHDDAHTNDQNSLSIYLGISYVIFSFIVVSEFSIINRSFIGSIADPAGRPVKILSMLDIRLNLYACQLLVFLAGIFVGAIVQPIDSFSFTDDCFGINGHYFISYILFLLIALYNFVDLCVAVFFYSSLSYTETPAALARRRASTSHSSNNSMSSQVSLNTRKSHSSISSEYDIISHFEMSDEIDSALIWKSSCRQTCKCIQTLTCNLFGGSNIGDDLEAVGRVLTDIYRHEGLLDVTITDIVAGIILLRHRQGSLMKSKIPINSRSKVSKLEYGSTDSIAVNSFLLASPDDEEECIVDEDKRGKFHRYEPLHSSGLDALDIQSSEYKRKLLRYSVYSVAVYSCMLRLYMRPCQSIAHHIYYLFKKTICRKCRTKRRKGNSKFMYTINGSDPCWGHRSAIDDWANRLDTQLVFSNFENDTRIKPYAVFYDELEDEIIIAIRGTLSLEDCITDALAEPALLHALVLPDNNGSPRFAHQGMLKAALKIKCDIEERQILRKLHILKSEVAGDMVDELEMGPSQVAKLVIVGHSLGAGLATLLAIMLKEEYPNLRCVGFGTPGSIVDVETARDVASYVTSVVLGSDFICRASFHSIVSLKENVLDSITKARLNKSDIYKSVWIEKNMSDLFYGDNEEPNSDFLQTVNEYKRVQRQTLLNNPKPRLTLPGRIIHIDSTNFRQYQCTPNCSSSAEAEEFTLRESSMTDFEEILISPTMFWDHFPDRYMYQLEKIADIRL